MRDVSVFEKKQVMGAFVFSGETLAQGLDSPAVASQGCLYNAGVVVADFLVRTILGCPKMCIMWRFPAGIMYM